MISSSMVYESATVFPTPEGAQLTSPPPISTYGFQKLASEYFAKGAWEQFQLPYTIVRPFNCVGIGERRAVRDTDIMSGNVKLALSHVVPDLVLKVLKGQDPLHILGEGNQVRHYTYGGDLAHGIRLAMESPAAVNDDFNLSTAASTTVLELAEAIWHKIHTDGRPFHYVSDAPFEHDVQLRIPDVRKATRGPRVRGVHDARHDARRGHPLDRRGSGGRPAVTWSLTHGSERSPDLYGVRFDDARGQREGRRLAGDRPASCSGTSMPTRRCWTSPAIAGTSSASWRRGSGGRPTSATSRRRCRPRSGSSRPPGSTSANVVPNGHFGTIFMSNYLEHLESGDAVDRAVARRVAAAPARRPGRSCCSRTSGSSVRTTGTSSTIASP